MCVCLCNAAHNYSTIIIVYKKNELHVIQVMHLCIICYRTIKFWDLETFEPISSTLGESHGVR